MSGTVDLNSNEFTVGHALEFEEPQFRQDPASHREDQAITPKSVARLPMGPLRSIDYRRLNDRAQLLEQLALTLPVNEYNLPTHVYRPDMLDLDAFVEALKPPDSSTPTTQAPIERDRQVCIQNLVGQLDAAVVHLYYAEGFPTLSNGIPFWQNLTFEPKEAYDAFIDYLELGGARQISQLHSYNLDTIREYFHLYYWGLRVKAFDLYRVAHAQKLKVQRMISTEDTHYRMAEKLMAKVFTYLEDAEFNEETLTPDKAVAMMEKLVKIQRISVGLPAAGESRENTAVRTPQSTTVIMQQISKGNEAAERPADSGMELLLEDQSSIDLAQELIIRRQSAHNEQDIQENREIR